ncbi:MAG: M48 family metallopeptidase [Treponema sp.]|jgi:predicted Zn-dependent protease|nr:M48 family metallopeptidase [Treponema sp.]
MKKQAVARKAGILLFVVFQTVPFLSCKTVADIAGAGAQIAGELGVIDQGTADAITKSSEAVGRAAEDITPEQEYYIGRAVGANILTSYRIWNGSPALTAYLNRICNTIVINSPRPEIYNGYHVAILNSDEINAFATSGGHIFITRGLIACTDSEDSLAGVIAHEISHIQMRHSLRAIKASRFTQAVVVTASSAAGVVAEGMDLAELTDIFNESVGEIVTTLVNNGYSQTQELDADNNAMTLMAAAGYEPSALISMLQVLEKNQGSHPGGFNKTHPTPARRITNARLSLRKYEVPDTRAYRRDRYIRAK